VAKLPVCHPVCGTMKKKIEPGMRDMRGMGDDEDEDPPGMK
jgi:hypothetical protein